MAPTSQPEETPVNRDTNLAAWMIAGGPTSVDPSEARNLTHVRAIAAAQPGKPRLVARLAAATISAVRPAPAPNEPACCPA
jgi:hypothetical protein